MKTVCFLIPGRLDKPVGGHKVVYDYANGLASDGIGVVIANCIFIPSRLSPLKEQLRKAYAMGKYVYRNITGRNSCRGWYDLDSRVRESPVWTFDRRFMPSADIYVATAAVTAHYLLNYPVSDKHKVYFIQGYENWNLSDEELKETYQFPFTKIVISKWLKTILENEDSDCYLVPNGFSSEEFYCTVPAEQKDKFSVSMMYHTMPQKNCQMAFEALEKVKVVCPELHVNIFSVYDCPTDLPEWYSFYKTPDRATHIKINNESSIYVAPSSSEGFGLTVGEAMMCGQAVVCTDTKGYLEMAVDGENALVSHIGDVDALANNIIRLIQDDAFRIRIAENGRRDITAFSVDNSYRLFKQSLGM